MSYNKALIIVDAQRTFMPAEEGERLGEEGFGELPVPGGHEIIPVLNGLTQVFLRHRMEVVTTADNHPEGTAHFSETPNFINTWPEHAKQGTPGAKLHPKLLAGMGLAEQFIKGDIVARTPDEDDSYTGALAHRLDPETKADILLPDYLRAAGIQKVYIGGLTTAEGTPDSALCVDSTALDLHAQGFNVAIIKDAIKPLNEAQYETCLRNLGAFGMRIMTAEEVAMDVIHTPHTVQIGDKKL